MKNNKEKLNRKQKFYLKSVLKIMLCIVMMFMCRFQGGTVITVLTVAIALVLVYIILN